MFYAAHNPTLASATVTALAAGFMLVGTPAKADSWVSLGEQTAAFRSEKDVFPVGRAAGRFTSLRFRVSDAQLAIADVVVVYANGTVEGLNVKEHLHPGEITRPYDLTGDQRRIDRIEVVYETDAAGYGSLPARLEILGAKVDQQAAGWPSPSGYPAQPSYPLPAYPQPGPGVEQGQPAPGAWDTLGVRHVGFLVDRDSIAVGLDKGRFRALKMQIMRHDIYVYEARITFVNGETQDVPVGRWFEAGTETPTLDLAGTQRGIERIDLVYRTRPGLHGQAQVAVLGQH
jgi:hypothetical protein